MQAPEAAPQPYLEAARQGRTSLLSYLAGVALILLFWQFLGALPISVLMVLDGALGPNQPSLEGLFVSQPLPAFLGVMFTFVFFLLGMWVAMRLAHRRRLVTLITPDGKPNWRRFAQGFTAWLALSAAQSLIEAWLHPGRYVWSLDAPRFFSFLLPVLLLIPIQAGTEELFFRGYLLQAFGLKLRSIWLLSLLSGLLFALPHLGNPEVSINFWALAFYYFLTGAFLAYITLRDQRLELALGVHIANNLFTALFANYTVSALPTPALFTVGELDATFAVAGYIFSVAAFYLVFFFRFPKPEAATGS